MRRSPDVLHIFAAHLSLLRDLFVVLSSVMRLRQQLCRRTALCSVLIGGPADLLPGARDIAKLAQAHVVLIVGANG